MEKRKIYNRAEAMKLYAEEQNRIFKDMQEQHILFNMFKAK